MDSPTPYDGTSAPFTIGLKPLDLDDWIEVDDTFNAQLGEKRRLYAAIPDKVLVEEAATRDAQQELLDLITAHMAAHFPEKPGLTAAEKNLPPLHAASLLVQEDLILMRQGETGWRLAAGSLCFPSSWTLTEKFGLPIHSIHQPVPGFGEGSRNNQLITRMFDRLHQPVQRYNWSIQASNALYHPLSNAGREERTEAARPRFGDNPAASAFIRVERQTLRKLPVSGDIVFTIRIYLDPLGWLRRHPERATIAASFAGQLMALDQAQLDYKGFTADRDRLVATLNLIASEAS